MEIAMRYQALIFDLDGTLLDTLDDLADSVNVVLRMHGYPTKTRAEVCSYVGNGIANLVERILPGGREDARYDRALADFKQYVSETNEKAIEDLLQTYHIKKD